jgi:predicted alpha/beta superfamily hydrolase
MTLLMVGITYSGDHADYDGLRAMDYTPTADPHVKGSGNGPNFLKFLKMELIPFMEANYRADSSRRVLQGSSYAGLFTLYALISRATKHAVTRRRTSWPACSRK